MAMPQWISLILRRFGKSGNLNGEVRSVEASAIPTATMVADWAKDKRDDISEMWIFGSSLDHDSWDALGDDLDILLVVDDDKWKPDTEREIIKQLPLSDHYLPMDVRVRRESDCEPWRTQARLHVLPDSDGEEHNATIAEHAMRTGLCVWRRSDDNDEGQES